MWKTLPASTNSSGTTRSGWLLRSVLVGGVLLLGGGVGLSLNALRTTQVPPAPDVDVSGMSGARLEGSGLETAAVLDAGPRVSVRPSVLQTAAIRIDPAQITPPADPFQPSRAEVLPSAMTSAPTEQAAAAFTQTGRAEATFSAAPTAPHPTPSAPMSAPAPAEPAAPAPAAVEEPMLTGLIQGKPSLAVVRYQGQSFFLKAGDQIFDQWRLVEVRERSAVFELGAKQVEISIRGGSSE